MTKYQQSEFAFDLFILLPSRSRLPRSHFAANFSISFLLAFFEIGCFFTASKKKKQQSKLELIVQKFLILHFYKFFLFYKSASKVKLLKG